MLWIMALGCTLGFCLGLLIRLPRERTGRLLSPIEELVEETEWLPITHLFTQKRDGHTYTHDARIMEFEGEIRLISYEFNPDTAEMYHNKVKVRLTDKQRHRLGKILNERITRGALDSTITGLLEA